MSKYQFNDIQENSNTSLVNETMRTALFTSLDLGNTRVSEQVFINKAKFEENARTELSAALPGSTIHFEYLSGTGGSIKAVELTVVEATGETYSSTYKVNETIQGG